MTPAGGPTQALRALPALADGDPVAENLYDLVRTNMWVEFAVPHLEGARSVESLAFWASLERHSPDLAAEARNCHAARPALEMRKDSLKRDAVLASRQFFFAEHELLYVRLLAKKLGFVPSNLDVHVIGGRVCVSGGDLQSGGQWEGLQAARSNDGFIKGTRQVFPFDGPSCRYEALFDARPEFDALREAFMVFAPDSSPRPFFNFARESGIDVEHDVFFAFLLHGLNAQLHFGSLWISGVDVGRHMWLALATRTSICLLMNLSLLVWLLK